MKANFDSILSSVLQSIDRRVIRGIQDDKPLSLLKALDKYDNLLACNHCGEKEREQIQKLTQDIKYQCPEICNFSTRIVNTKQQVANLPPQSDDALFRFQLPQKYSQTLFLLPYEQVIVNYYDPDGDPEDGFKIEQIGDTQWLYISGNYANIGQHVVKNSEIKGGFKIPYRIVHGEETPHIGLFQEERFKELYKDYVPRLNHFGDACKTIEEDDIPIVDLSTCPTKPKVQCGVNVKEKSEDPDEHISYVEFSKLNDNKDGFDYIRFPFDDKCCRVESEFKIKVKDDNWYKDLYANKNATIKTEYVAQWEDLPNCCENGEPLIYSPRINRPPFIYDNKLFHNILAGLNNNLIKIQPDELVHKYFDAEGSDYKQVDIDSLRFDGVAKGYLKDKTQFVTKPHEEMWFANQYVFFDYENDSVVLLNDYDKTMTFLKKTSTQLVFQKYIKDTDEFIEEGYRYKEYKEKELKQTFKVKVQDDDESYPMWSKPSEVTLIGIVPNHETCTNDERKKLIFVK